MCNAGCLVLFCLVCILVPGDPDAPQFECNPYKFSFCAGKICRMADRENMKNIFFVGVGSWCKPECYYYKLAKNEGFFLDFEEQYNL